MIIHDKLVRDNIPKIIEAAGKQYSIKVLDKKECIPSLITKFSEEITEFQDDYSVEELADILEIVHGLAYHLEIDLETLEDVRKEKKAKRGGFEKGIYLEKVW